MSNDYRYCEEIIRRNSSSFYAAFRRLPPERANAVYAVYAFCRTADDLADEGASDAEWAAFEAQFEGFRRGEPADAPMWRALADAFGRYRMDINPFEDMMRGQRWDRAPVWLHDLSELDEYCDLVAGSVGRMLLPILTDGVTPAGLLLAEELGRAMQYTNILRDVGEDARRGRVYLPRTLMANWHCLSEDLVSGAESERFVGMCEFLALRAHVWYRRARDGLAVFLPDARRPMRLAIGYYGAILDKCERENFPSLTRRVYLSQAEKLRILLRSVSER